MEINMRQRNTLQFQYFRVSINVSDQASPNEVLKFSGYIFWLRLL